MSAARIAFTFHHCLGEGGYGEVYLARQLTEGGITREVAVKVLRDQFDDTSQAVKRLRDEGQVLALLSHPVILRVHGFAKVQGRLALVTEYVEGADVSTFCVPENLLPPRIAVEVAREVAEALAYALTVPNPHTGRPLKMIHRDVKPANVRVSVDGKVKLLDFGVARTNEMDRQAKTAMGDVLLTSGFAAPEALGFGVSGPSVDVFALGVTLFAMLTGKQFYRGRDLKFQVTLAMNAVDFAAYLDERLLLVEHEGVRALLHRVLQFQHELRPTAAEIAEELEALHDAMEGPTLGRWARSREWPQQILEGAELEGKSIDTDGQVVSPSQVPPPPRTPTPPPAPPPALGGASSVVPMDARNVSPGKVPSPAAPPPRQTPAPERPAARPPPPPPPPSRSPVMMIGVGIVVLVVLGVLVSVLLAVLAAALYVVA